MLELPMAGDGSLPPLPLLLRRIAAEPTAEHCRLAAWPDGTVGLPEILALAAIERLEVPAREGWPAAWCWRGAAGHRLAVGAAGAEAPLHAGPIPPGAWNGGSASASWAEEAALRVDEAGWLPTSAAGASWSVWNPLPFSRRGLAILDPAAVATPAGLVDAAGRRSPVQVTSEGLLALLELPALGTTDCQPAPDPGAIAVWTVSPRVVDNGRLRAEFDPAGRIVRLCIDGRFIDPLAPLVALEADGAAATAEATAEILERGPIRAAIRFEQQLAATRLQVTYRLVAEATWLEVEVEALDAPQAMLQAEHPLRPLAETLDLVWEHGRERLPQLPSLAAAAPAWRRGWRCAATAGSPSGAGLLILALEPAALQAIDHRLVLAAPGRLRYGLAASGRSSGLPAQLAARWPIRSGAGSLACPRLIGDGAIVPLWLRRREDGRSELLVSETRGFRSRVHLLLEAAACAGAAPTRIDLDGRSLQALTQREDGWELDLAGGELALLAWA